MLTLRVLTLLAPCLVLGEIAPQPDELVPASHLALPHEGMNQVTAISFNSTFGSNMVLQQAPAKSCVYGTLGTGGTGATVRVSSKGDVKYEYEVRASLTQADQWKACLDPHPAGGEFTLTASCTGCENTTSAVIGQVTFGDVWYCGGQSNMALPLLHTMSRNISRDKILSGQYSNIRLFGIQGNMNPHLPWSTLEDALATDPDSEKSAFMSFSSTCFYFGESLTDALLKAGKPAVPIGLIHTAWGGSMIEQWLDNKTIASCANASLSPVNGEWHQSRVLPLTGMTLKGWVWYQGENDMHGFFGNAMRCTGYSCMMAALVGSWRQLWSSTPGTTASDAPFGLVTLAPSGGEGGRDIGTMRWAQTAGYGVLPNPAMPNTFLAQAYDLDDPFSNISCYHLTGCPAKPEPPQGWGGCKAYCDSLSGTNYYMGPIHPRDKKPVGDRLANGAAAIAYGVQGLHSTGPTIAGCTKAGNKLTVKFNASLMSQGTQDRLVVQPYNKQTGASKMHVLVNSSLWCMQTGGRGDVCIDDGWGQQPVGTGFDSATTWVAVDISLDVSDSNSIVVDLTKTAGVAFGIRYAWQGDCCSENPPTDGPCPIKSCPLIATPSDLPANPFMAKIVNDKCSCVPPQVCDQ